MPNRRVPTKAEELRSARIRIYAVVGVFLIAAALQINLNETDIGTGLAALTLIYGIIVVAMMIEGYRDLKERI